jgi:flavodoxin I
MNIGLIFGTDTGNTEEIAEKLQSLISWAEVTTHNVADVDPEEILAYDYLILGVPTWDFGGMQSDWEDYWPVLENLDFTGKTIALFGLGDQFGYGNYFLDAMGMIFDVVIAQGANVVAPFSIEGFGFEESKALTSDGKNFVGLALDEDQEFDLSDERIERWLITLKKDMQDAYQNAA